MFRRLAVCACVAALSVSCGGGGGGSGSQETRGGLVVARTRMLPHAVEPDAEVALGDSLIVYLASEADDGADLNADGDQFDRVAIAFDALTEVEQVLPAAIRAHVLGENVYLTTAEIEDGIDWNQDGDQFDNVLLHWSPTIGAVSFLATLRRTAIAVGRGVLYFSSESEAPMLPLETRLQFVAQARPRTIFSVEAATPITGADPSIVESEAGVLFLSQAEATEGIDLNGDGDQFDTVLALLDTTRPDARIQNVGFAWNGGSDLEAHRLLSGERVVAFFVWEFGQGATNLNDPALLPPGWVPPQCAGLADRDAVDNVLHFLELEAWILDPALNPPVNTGFVGSERAFVLERPAQGRFVVGAVSREADEGLCSLNGDGDRNDHVLRFGEVLGGSFRAQTKAENLAAISQVPGGFGGVATVTGRLIAAVSEAQDGHDWDGNPGVDLDLLAFIDPFAGPIASWTVPKRPEGTALGVSWLVQHASELGMMFGDQEKVLSASCNSADEDTDDMFAQAVRFGPGNELEWNGHCFAAQSFNPGIVVEGDHAFFRASEAEQGADVDEDGDTADSILLRHEIFPLKRLFYVDVLNDLDAPAVHGPVAGSFVYLTDEAMAGEDRNGDGDMLDHVLGLVDG